MFNAIDVSKWQGTINWDTVKAAGIDHVMLRAGWGRYSNQVDPQFKRNVSECKRLGIDWGAYWYSYATSVDEAIQEARCFLQVVKDLNPTMPLAYDMEYEPGILALSNATRTAMVKAFIDELESAGYYGMLYASTDFIKNRLNWQDLAKYDVWCAQYGSVCTCPLPHGIWQYSSSNALNVPGFGSSLDCNKVYKDYPNIIKAAGLNGWPKNTDEGANNEPVKEQEDTKLQTPSISGLNDQQLNEFVSLASQLKLNVTIEHTVTFQPVTQGDADKILMKTTELGLKDKYKSDWV